MALWWLFLYIVSIHSFGNRQLCLRAIFGMPHCAPVPLIICVNMKIIRELNDIMFGWNSRNRITKV